MKEILQLSDNDIKEYMGKTEVQLAGQFGIINLFKSTLMACLEYINTDY